MCSKETTKLDVMFQAGFILLSAQQLHQIFVVVVVITPSLPVDGGTARTAIQVHALNLIKTRLAERLQLISNQS